MTYIGGSQFSVDNRTDNELFSCINRADMMEKIKADIMPMGYTGRIQANSSANYARNPYSQLANDYGVNNRDTSLLQYKGFKDDKIDASSRATQSASRFNYAYDRQINKRYVDVSGQFIPNNKLRVLPNRSCSMYGTQPLPYDDPDLKQLSNSLMSDAIDLTYNVADANKYLKYKVNRPKLTRQDLMEASQQYARARQQTAQPTQPAQPAPRPPSSFAGVNRLTAISQGIRDLNQQYITGLSIYDPTRGGVPV
jgi:hypothetical protein